VRDTSAIAPDPQCDLLRHCPGRHEHRGLLAEQLGDLLLETLDALAGAVHVHPLVLARLIGERREAVAPGWAAAPSVEEALGTLDGGSEALFVHLAESIACGVRIGPTLVGRHVRQPRRRGFTSLRPR